MADATLDLATVWDQIRERLATSLSPQQNAMLNLTRPLGLVEDTAVLAAPNEFTQTVLEVRPRVPAEHLVREVDVEDVPPKVARPSRSERRFTGEAGDLSQHPVQAVDGGLHGRPDVHHATGSPIARESPRMVPVAMPGTALGSVLRHVVCQTVAPRASEP